MTENGVTKIKDRSQMELATPIKKFFAEQSVLITGVTGFLGKLLIEKLLRSCPEITFIYVIVRAKRGQNAQARLKQIFEGPIFERVKEEVPEFSNKVKLIEGDMSLPDLGISESDKEILQQEVSIVFNVAATVRFDEKLKQAIVINVNGPKKLVKLCKNMNKLKSIIHVSTFYSNCVREEIDEKFYPPPVTGEYILNLAENFDEEQLNAMTDSILKEFPNTYTFTKAIAEDVMREASGHLPVGIFRPAIVLSTYREPIPGWSDNILGLSGAIAAAGLGLLRVVHADRSLVTELVPADFTVNALIASAWDVGINRKSNKGPFIYNYCSSWNNPITVRKFWDLTLKYGKTMPTIKAFWCYIVTVVQNYHLYFVLSFSFHTIPALLIDAVLFLMGKRTLAIKIYKKIHKFSTATSYFGLHQWDAKLERTKSLWSKISDDDKKTFTFSMQNFDWDDFTRTYVSGLRLYILKDPPNTIPEAKKRMARFVLIHRLVKYTFMIFVIWASYFLVSFLICQDSN